MTSSELKDLWERIYKVKTGGHTLPVAFNTLRHILREFVLKSKSPITSVGLTDEIFKMFLDGIQLAMATEVMKEKEHSLVPPCPTLDELAEDSVVYPQDTLHDDLLNKKILWCKSQGYNPGKFGWDVIKEAGPNFFSDPEWKALFLKPDKYDPYHNPHQVKNVGWSPMHKDTASHVHWPAKDNYSHGFTKYESIIKYESPFDDYVTYPKNKKADMDENLIEVLDPNTGILVPTVKHKTSPEKILSNYDIAKLKDLAKNFKQDKKPEPSVKDLAAMPVLEDEEDDWNEIDAMVKKDGENYR